MSAISAAAASSRLARGAASRCRRRSARARLYSFDSLANSPPPSRGRQQAAPSSACRRRVWSSRDSSSRSIADRLQPAAAPPARRAATSLCSPLSRSRSVATPRASSSSPSKTAARAPIRSARLIRCAGLAANSRARRSTPARAQLLGQRQRRGFGRRADRHDAPPGAAAAGGSASSIASRSMPAAQPTAGHARPAHLLDQAVVAAAAHHRALRAERRSVTNSKAVWV